MGEITDGFKLKSDCLTHSMSTDTMKLFHRNALESIDKKTLLLILNKFLGRWDLGGMEIQCSVLSETLGHLSHSLSRDKVIL